MSLKCLPLSLGVSCARGGGITDADFERFANDLVTGAGSQILRAWRNLGGTNVTSIRHALHEIELLRSQHPAAGPLKGLLLGSPERFLQDLAMMLEFKAGGLAFIQKPDKVHLAEFVGTTEAWQQRHGYEDSWWWPELRQALKQLNAPAVDAAVAPKLEATTPFQRIAESLALTETETPRLLEAMRACANTK